MNAEQAKFLAGVIGQNLQGEWMHTYKAINARVQAMRFRTNQDEAKWKVAVKEHERMIDALDARDGKALAAVLIEHLNNKRDTVLALMRAGDVYAGSGRS